MNLGSGYPSTFPDSGVADTSRSSHSGRRADTGASATRIVYEGGSRRRFNSAMLAETLSAADSVATAGQV